MSHFDRLRGYYVRSPRWVQASAGRILAVTPARLLYGKTFWRWRADIEHSELDADFVERRLAAGIAAALDAAARTEYYSDAIGAHGPVTPTLDGLVSLPVLTKEQVRRSAERMLAVPKRELDEVTTGGTSSMVPLTFYLDRDRSVKEWAFLTHLWGRIGYRPGDRLGILGYRGVTHLPGASSRPWAWEPGTRELRLSPFRMVPRVMDEYLTLIERYAVTYLYAYPSAISLLAAHARARRWTPSRSLRGILLMSEALRPHQREVIMEGFAGRPILCGYGLSEKVAIAGELPDRPDVYEFEPLYGYAELVDDEGCVIRETGRRGRLIGTGFISVGMPMIRYDTGDLATLVRLPSRENRWRLRVRDITSRHSQDYLVTSEGGLIAHTVIYPHNRVVRECQFVQEEPGRAILRLVPEADTRREELEDIVRVVHARADGLLKVDLEVVEEIPGSRRGKKLVVVQRLDLARFGLE